MARVALHIHALGPGGAERIALCWAAWLQEAGHEVHLLLGRRDIFFTAPDGVQLVIYPTSGLPKLTVVWLWHWLHKYSPDLAIGITTRPSLNLLLASLGRPWPVVVAERNYPPARPLNPLLWLLRRCLYPQAALHLVQTKRIGTWLEKRGLAQAQHIATLANPILWPLPTRKGQGSLEKAQLPPKALLLLAVGTKPYQKGFDRLLAAFSDIASDCPNCWLALVGISINHPQLQLALKILTPTARARLLMPGIVSDIDCWYARATIFVLPSRYEGSPNALQEAMAAGCACIATDCPTGPREVIQQNINGILLSEPCNITTLASAISSLIKDVPRRQRLAEHALRLRKTHAESMIRVGFLKLLDPLLAPRLLLLVPTRRLPTETFIRANLAHLSLQQQAYFGDEFCGLCPWRCPGQYFYGLAITLSKICTRLGFQRLSTLPGSLVTYLLVCFHRPQVILAEFGFHAVRVMDAAVWSGVPLVVHFRGSDASAHRRLWILQERYRRLMRLASAVIVKSQSMRRVLEGLGADPSIVTVSPSGANPDLFYGANPATAPPLALFIGRLVPKKAPLDALEAFTIVRRQLSPALASQIKLEFIGEGPLRKALEKRIRELELSEQVQLIGLRSPEEIAIALRHARCLLQPSRTAPDGDAEGCPVAVIEAQLSGVPVISTQHAGIPEVVVDGYTGLLVPEGAVGELAVALKQVMQDPVLASNLGKAGRKRSLKYFTIKQHIQVLTKILTHQARRVQAFGKGAAL
ncbi:glycosyl transferase family 1 [cyanobiont of Ornithocercus magnificus]|nr:glycosyl transferase family 1 [cyanobiont of Ornithocercus magnificus]